MILLDTSVLIRQFRNYDDARDDLFIRLKPVLCGMVVSEFMAGAIKPAQMADCELFLLSFGVAATPETVWDAAGRNQALLKRTG